MSKQAKRRQYRPSAPPPHQAACFVPVDVRARYDGWTPGRQIAFVTALAGCACIEEACAAVGMSPRSFYSLRARPDAGSFRQAVDAALDLGVHRVAEAMLGRALHGEVTPIFYKGEQVGERRRFDNRLGMFILRVRAPERYGKWRDAVQQTREHPDGAAIVFQQALRNLAEDAVAQRDGRPRPEREPLKTVRMMDDPVEIAEREDRMSARELDARRRAYDRGRMLDRLAGEDDGSPAGPDFPDDVSRSS